MVSASVSADGEKMKQKSKVAVCLAGDVGNTTATPIFLPNSEKTKWAVSPTQTLVPTQHCVLCVRGSR